MSRILQPVPHPQPASSRAASLADRAGRFVSSAARILQSLDRSAQPCEDFYQFACGGWIRRNPVPESQSSWDQFRVLRGDLLVQLRELLEAKGSDDDLQPVKQARALYRTCMDTERLEQMGVRPMVGVLRQLGVGEAPPPPGEASRARPAPFDWVHALGSAHRVLGLNVLFGFWVDQIPPGISERYLLQPERFETELREYRRYVRDMIASYARHQGRDARRRRHHFPSSDAADDRDEDDRYEEDEDEDDDVHGPGPVLSALRGDAGGIMTTAEQRRDTRRVFHEMSVRDLQKLMTVPQPGALMPMNWTRYLETVFSNTNVTLDFNKDIVVVMDSTYLEKLAGLLANTDQATLGEL
ncbi:Endothelin-converting enzyme homolog [Gryllus bimaculatus]|nr:Endothelin-converting enzyme homolog [Gryllus bimaculatus]